MCTILSTVYILEVKVNRDFDNKFSTFLITLMEKINKMRYHILQIIFVYSTCLFVTKKKIQASFSDQYLQVLCRFLPQNYLVKFTQIKLGIKWFKEVFLAIRWFKTNYMYPLFSFSYFFYSFVKVRMKAKKELIFILWYSGSDF